MHSPTRITLDSPQTFRNAFLFPWQSQASRRDLFWGGLWLLLCPPVGWLLNMGHRVVVTHRLLAGEQDPWPAWRNPGELFRHGLITFAGMVLYHLPATLLFAASAYWNIRWLWWAAAILWLLATCVIPGYMTAYCRAYDPREVFNIPRSIRRVWRASMRGMAGQSSRKIAGNTDKAAPAGYWKAWTIALAALACSLLGLFGLVLFLWTSVWFWQVAAFAFAKAMRDDIHHP